MLPFQLDSPFVGNAGVKFREGSAHSKLTHPLVSHWRVKNTQGSGYSKLTTLLSEQRRVKFGIRSNIRERACVRT